MQVVSDILRNASLSFLPMSFSIEEPYEQQSGPEEGTCHKAQLA